MINNVKIMSMYLPQFHHIPENDKFWGEGFTDWVAVKHAKQYLKDIKQPKEPLDDNYYDLSNIESIRKQVQLANEYGIDGFCFYHYWFNSNTNLLSKPAELFLNDKSLKLDFCFAWDNISWKRTWSASVGNDWAPIMDDKIVKHDTKEQEILVKFDYEEEQGWEKHFNYLLPFFKDERYIKKNNKPVFIMWNIFEKDTLVKMMDYWNKLAIKNGFEGIYFIGQYKLNDSVEIFDSTFFYQPVFSGWCNPSFFAKCRNKLSKLFEKENKPRKYSYDHVWKKILKLSKNNKNNYYGGFVNYDDTPRRGAKGTVITGSTPAKFNKYLNQLINICKENDKEYVFLTAWNEWGEGAYLEPDKESGYAYLSQIKSISDN